MTQPSTSRGRARTAGAQLNLAGGIREFARSTPAATALVDGDRRMTFAELGDRSDRVAALLADAGSGAGGRVAVLLGNRLEYVEIAAGAAKAGAVLVPLDPRGTAAEHAALIDRSGASGLVADAAFEADVPDAAEDLPLVLRLGAGSWGRPYERALAASRAADPRADVGETDPFCVQYTSGTTGRPKGALLTHRSRVLTMFGCAVDYGLGPGRRTAAVAPMAHGAGFCFAYAGPFLGGTTSMMRRWDPEELLRMIERDRLQTVFLVPTHAHALRRVMEQAPRRHDLSSLETMYFDAAALPVPLKEWVIDAFPGVGVHELYGSTEAGIVTNLRPPDALRKAGTVGHPWWMTEVALLAPDGREAGPGEPGELFSRSPFTMLGYLDDPGATAEAVRPDGFLTSGDVAVRDDEGFIAIVDRTKDVIVSGGSNIYPREIENVLAGCDGVAEAAVVGLPDEKWGEVPGAFVVPRPGRDLDFAALEAAVRAVLAPYKAPKVWRAVDALPRNTGGKILKRVLREVYGGPR
ncbi:class I adenylate-forming enzyme family protein [Actinomadura rifamycini]|uniref:class I adenylate-forming enzyme family protein n=1 Tax=Actinomadura rifamycini TaxID=31962 RepID=UPI0004081321|nr:AMP-binding protein [Actinomadura rifamycini]